MGKEMGKEKEKGERKRKQVAIPDRESNRPRMDGASSSTSAPLGNGGGLQETPEGVTADTHSVSTEPTPLQPSAEVMEAQGEPPTKWNFNLDESSGGPLALLPPVPRDVIILQALPSEEELASLPEALFRAMMRCWEQHRMVG